MMPKEIWFMNQYDIEELIRKYMTEYQGVPKDDITEVTFLIEDGEKGFRFRGAQVEFGSDY